MKGGAKDTFNLCQLASEKVVKAENTFLCISKSNSMFSSVTILGGLPFSDAGTVAITNWNISKRTSKCNFIYSV